MSGPPSTSPTAAAPRKSARGCSQDAEAASRAKDQFLATLSHELRTPLNAVVGWAHMLRSGKLDEAATARAIETIDRNARAQSQLISDILDISRIVSGKLRLNVRPVDLTPVVEAALDTVRPAADAKGIRLQAVLDPAAGPVSGDADRLQQVIWNLLANAIKFTPRSGRVQVRLARINSHVELRVEDTGVGIGPEFMPHVFELFRQRDGSPSRQHGGLGLGLALVKHLVELHGGSVECASPGEGMGAVFSVKLPLMIVATRADGVHPTAETGAAMPPPPSLDGVSVLVVDDDPDARHLISTLLEERGARVRAVGSSRGGPGRPRGRAARRAPQRHRDAGAGRLRAHADHPRAARRRRAAASRRRRSPPTRAPKTACRRCSPGFISTCRSRCSRPSWRRSSRASPAGRAEQWRGHGTRGGAASRIRLDHERPLCLHLARRAAPGLASRRAPRRDKMVGFEEIRVDRPEGRAGLAPHRP